MEPFKQVLDCLVLEEWQKYGLTAGFTLKTGKNMGLHVGDIPERVVENRQEVAKQIGFPLDYWVATQQTHQEDVFKVDERFCGHGSKSYDSAIANTDGIYTNGNGVLLTLCFADCVPVFFLHPEKRLVGLVHAGWKGTALGISGRLVRIWEEREQVNPAEVQVVIGPSICADCYVVNEPVVRGVEDLLGEVAREVYVPLSEGEYRIDLKKANFYYLQQVGVLSENIAVSNHCTACESDLFFSHRRDVGGTGRMMAYIGWKA